MKLLAPFFNNSVTISLVGMCKNAGKTTVLNTLLSELPRESVTALTSIGRDGESADVVTGTDKPAVCVKEGTVVATATALLPKCDTSAEILCTTGIPTPLGEVIIFRARSGGNVQLAGPSIVSQLVSLKETLLSLGAQRIIIDGALDRRSPANCALADSAILCTGASMDISMEKVVRGTAHILKMMKLDIEPAEPAALLSTDGKTLEDNDTVFAKGAVHEKLLEPLLRKGLLKERTIVAEDPSKILIGADFYEKLLIQNTKLKVLHRPNVPVVTVNPFSAYGNHFNAEEFISRMKQAVDIPVIDVKAGVLL